MLVISRRKGQSITIGDEIELVVTELHRSSVKVGIRAPRGYAVLRGEIRDSIATANQTAALSTIEDAYLLEGQLQHVKGGTQELSLTLRQVSGATESQTKDSTQERPAPAADALSTANDNETKLQVTPVVRTRRIVTTGTR